VRQLVRDEAVEAAIPGDEGRRQESERRVLHAPVREARRQYDHVVAAPAIGAVKPLSRLDHLLGIGGFVGRSLQRRRLRPDAGAAAERLEGEIARRDGDEIGRDRLVHRVGEGAAVTQVFGIADLEPAHHHRERLGRGNPRAPGLADARAVLRGDPGPVEDRLALAEQEGMLLACRLLCVKPL